MNHIADIVLECCSLSVNFFYHIKLGFAPMNHSIENRTAQLTFDLLAATLGYTTTNY